MLADRRENFNRAPLPALPSARRHRLAVEQAMIGESPLADG
jgi:hypothetical protein